MLVSIILEWPCPCGTTAKGVTVKQRRINKLSMRTTGQALGLMPRICKGCGGALPDTLPVSARLADDSLTAVNAYRERKGWFPLTAADTTRQAGGV
ncbi:hypothetical protein [Micromonospora sp. CB01531]|uniref:hypothetical protein n=1 Tax=Micromonospora sp. CB01531 TaxID=1718947 RepID=UPI0009400AF4|nr:hypothetical protein [Micromonospora sp. CB01531]OKI47278.1 hypothetical protein A6A27_10550 [Micromonospora sp. CB01531]